MIKYCYSIKTLNVKMHSASQIYFLIRSLMDICNYETLLKHREMKCKTVVYFSRDEMYLHVYILPTKSSFIYCTNWFIKVV